MNATKIIQQKWNDGTIPNKAKGEGVKKFIGHFNYKNRNRFYWIMSSQVLPTPDELEFLRNLVSQYWAVYNEEVSAD